MFYYFVYLKIYINKTKLKLNIKNKIYDKHGQTFHTLYFEIKNMLYIKKKVHLQNLKCDICKMIKQ